MELFLYLNANKVVPVTDAFRKRLLAMGIPSDKMEVITNGVDLDRFYEIRKDYKLIKQLGLSGKFVIGYIGTHGMAHGLDFIINFYS